MKKNILCIGAGYVGGPTMAVIAAKCPDYKVMVVDINKEKIDAWNSKDLPIHEPGLHDIVEKVRGKNLFYSTEVEKEIDKADIIFVSVNTPTKTFGEGAGKAADLQYWEKTARTIVKNSKSSKIVVEKSTLPVRTAEAMQRILDSNEKGIKFQVLSNPEFLAEGTAVRDMENPDRVLIGSKESKEGLEARQELVNIYKNWVPEEKIITNNIWSAELSKLVSNAFLAQRISSINSISALCEYTEANVNEISESVGADKRIGPYFLHPSVGFGGSCFEKDILNLVYIAESYNLKEVAEYWEWVIKINNYQKQRFVKKMLKAMFNTLAGKKIVLLGFAFKKDTDDTRNSPSIDVAKQLIEEQAHVVIHDPQALKNAKKDLAELDQQKIEYVEDVYQATIGAHAIAIMTEWDIYKELDYREIYKKMEKPAFAFDGRDNVLDEKEMYKIGFNTYPLGKKSLMHF